MTNVKMELHNMYTGLVYVYWANANVKLGTAKQKSLQQMQSYVNTLDKNNPATANITSTVKQMKQNVSKQIMTDKSSEMMLPPDKFKDYKNFGQTQASASKQNLAKIIKQSKTKDNNELAREQGMSQKQNTPQYRATKTNFAEKAPKQLSPQTMSQQRQQQILAFIAKQHLQNAA